MNALYLSVLCVAGCGGFFALFSKFKFENEPAPFRLWRFLIKFLGLLLLFMAIVGAVLVLRETTF